MSGLQRPRVVQWQVAVFHQLIGCKLQSKYSSQGDTHRFVFCKEQEVEFV